MNYKDPAFLHSAGAIVKPRHPFSDLLVYRSDIPIDDKEFILKWVKPFYMDLPTNISNLVDNVISIKDQISKDIVRKLLSDLNWRTRQTGAFFTILMDYEEFMENIANLLLQSEVCYAGKTYSVVLGSYDKEYAKKYFIQYLNYYLTTPKYYFDQDFVLAGLISVSENSEDYAEILEKYGLFVKAQGRKNKIDNDVDHFRQCLDSLAELKKKITI